MITQITLCNGSRKYALLLCPEVEFSPRSYSTIGGTMNTSTDMPRNEEHKSFWWGAHPSNEKIARTKITEGDLSRSPSRRVLPPCFLTAKRSKDKRCSNPTSIQYHQLPSRNLGEYMDAILNIALKFVVKMGLTSIQTQ